MFAQAIALAAPFAPISEGRGRASSLDDRWPNTPIRLCAIRVEFQEDDLTGTTGNGTFGTGFPDSLLIDPLPHDRQYFEDHLAFLDHYFTTASSGRLDFQQVDVYPAGDNAAYRLSFPMWHYNFNTDTALLNQRLVELFAQSVTLADADIDFNQYDAVIVFHAGVGKDFNVGVDNTPFDIPSAYISESDLNRYGSQLPAGVTRGLLLPEAQNQPETLELGVELSLNGVMIKLFGNWLGMPDLFNTETGASGIGRWGMMDQGSGNVNAIVPALPDAWSRVFMGWSNATTIYPSGNGDTVTLGRTNLQGTTQIAKIHVTADEYYLMENRDADADSIGYVSLFDRNNREMRIDRDGDVAIEEGFKVAVRASHYDYGIPGSGILIWHINEKVIAEKYADNRVNSDPDNRGVDLVECDGSQDIGREYGFATSGSGTELGIQEDCWYRDNRAYREANNGSIFVRFNDDSRPSARLSDHSYTFLAISDFSDVDSVMTCRVRGTLAMNGFPVEQVHLQFFGKLPWTVADINQDGRQDICYQSSNGIRTVYDTTDSQVLWQYPGNPTILLNDLRRPIDFNRNGTDELWLHYENYFGYLEVIDGVVDTTFASFIDSYGAAHPIFVTGETENRLLLLGDLNNQKHAYLYDSSLAVINFQSYSEWPYTDVTNLSEFLSNTLLFWSSSKATLVRVRNEIEILWEIDLNSVSDRPTIVHTGELLDVFFPNHGYIDINTGELICSANDCLRPEVDWDQDGRVDGGGTEGANYTPRENFTYSMLVGQEVHDLDFNGVPDILKLLKSKNTDQIVAETKITAFDHDGRLFSGFPITVSGDAFVLQLDSSEHRYYVVTQTDVYDTFGSYSKLNLLRLPIVANGNEQAHFFDAENNIIFIGAPRPQVHAREEFAYVWPNPAAETAHIRLTLPYAAQADVAIYDLVGRKVASLSGASSYAGPFELDWQTSSVQSGIYIGKVEARGNGQTQTAELKIAVVR